MESGGVNPAGEALRCQHADMRRTFILTVALLAFASSALAATATVKIPPLFKHQIATLHGKGIGPIYLPETMPTGDYRGKLYPTVDSSGKAYELDIGAAPGCHGANACFVAEFSSSHQAPFNTVKVRLTGGATGYFRATSCGGSCSPASIEFRRSGFTYEMQARVGTEKTEKAALVAMANSALVHGAR